MVPTSKCLSILIIWNAYLCKIYCIVLLEGRVSSIYSILTRQTSNYVRTKGFLNLENILGPVALSPNAHVSVVKSVRLSVLSTTTEWITVKFVIVCFYEH